MRLFQVGICNKFSSCSRNTPLMAMNLDYQQNEPSFLCKIITGGFCVNLHFIRPMKVCVCLSSFISCVVKIHGGKTFLFFCFLNLLRDFSFNSEARNRQPLLLHLRETERFCLPCVWTKCWAQGHREGKNSVGQCSNQSLWTEALWWCGTTFGRNRTWRTQGGEWRRGRQILADWFWTGTKSILDVSIPCLVQHVGSNITCKTQRNTFDECSFCTSFNVFCRVSSLVEKMHTMINHIFCQAPSPSQGGQRTCTLHECTLRSSSRSFSWKSSIKMHCWLWSAVTNTGSLERMRRWEPLYVNVSRAEVRYRIVEPIRPVLIVWCYWCDFIFLDRLLQRC